MDIPRSEIFIKHSYKYLLEHIGIILKILKYSSNL